MLAAAAIEVVREGATLLDGAGVQVAPGETVALIGPNGAGKSTLLHALSGALGVDGGDVRLDDTALSRWPPAALARRRAVLPQSPALDFPLSAGEVVALGRSPHAGTPTARRDGDIVAEALAECDVAHLAGRMYTRLSGGERQRVQLARVLAQVWPDCAGDCGSARYLLLDEPTNNLDLAHQQRIAATARRFARRGHGVLAVLHDPNLAAQYADRIVVLAAGQVLAEGPPAAIVTEATMSAAFGVRTLCREHPVTGRPYMLPLPESTDPLAGSASASTIA